VRLLRPHREGINAVNRRITKDVTFRKMAADGTVIRQTTLPLLVTFNETTGRYVVPVRMQEGSSFITVRAVNDGVQVDVLREP
jgi:hypothetical protein